MMSELERLNKAIEWVERQIEETGMQPWPLVYLGPILDASRAYRDLLANGEPWLMCEEHHHRVNHPDLDDCMWGTWYDVRYPDGSRQACRITTRLLSVPPGDM